ncbi:hypothetical protein SLW70_06780 [Flavobacterium sp. NG2]|uniref:hypothetical protein n=1 Tax=Flavobacterium sp. NG2 TaxID=3097547 RepID=UPI002A837A24|nr:hypothetical protein [Flavobacterium sp. NG2]WPR72826.1 hypothetical protein SLW70_06780 [Flavobacterium sp. NG2]
MKKLIIAALLAVSLTGFAQDGKKKQSYAEKTLEKMATELTLTPDQQAKIKPMLEAKGELKKDDKENPDHVEDNKVKSKEIDKEISNLLTKEQRQLKKELKEKENAAKAAAAQ